MTKRMIIAALALAGAGLATYLAMYKLGLIGELACNVGQCETVNLSRWATLLGIPVAVWGVGFYVALFAVAFAGTTSRFADAEWVSHALLARSSAPVHAFLHSMAIPPCTAWRRRRSFPRARVAASGAARAAGAREALSPSLSRPCRPPKFRRCGCGSLPGQRTKFRLWADGLRGGPNSSM